MATDNWYNAWFGTTYYDKLYAHRDYAEAEFFINNIIEKLPTGASALDLGCGKGRHAVYLNSKGYTVTGIDLSEKNIEHCMQFANANLDFKVHDMRRFYCINTFDVVLNLFTSFGYFEKLHHNELALQAAYAALKQGGVMVLDYFNSTFVENLIPDVKVVIHDNIKFEIRKKIEDRFVIKEIVVSDDGREHTFFERVELITLKEFENLFAKAGFLIQQIYGNYKLEPFDINNSPRCIFIAQK
ncbi:MAG: methyltransferase domain-containing protein [Bacteroidetes bacterium]|nr:methyltransferase domain-containing protein [Bacteroidota bacterium]